MIRHVLSEPLSLLEALRLYCPDVALRVLVAGIQVAGIGMIGLEFQKLLAQVLAHVERRVAAEIGEGVVLFLSHMLAIGDPHLPYDVPPLRTTDLVLGCLTYPVPDVVVVADRIDGLVLGVVATAQ